MWIEYVRICQTKITIVMQNKKMWMKGEKYIVVQPEITVTVNKKSTTIHPNEQVSEYPQQLHKYSKLAFFLVGFHVCLDILYQDHSLAHF